MINNKTVLAVIPARAGSKRCPLKNIKAFRGKPLIWWTLKAAQASEYIDKIVISTDMPEIKNQSVKIAHFGYEVLDRPPELATDTATNEDVLRHALKAFPHDIIVLLQPTSPLRTHVDIDSCITLRDIGEENIISYDVDTRKKNGAVYVCDALWLENGNQFNWYYAKPYFMPHERSLDIDYEEQLE